MPKSDDTRVQSVLVTGGAGYAGSWVVRTLLETGFQVTCVDKLMFGAESLLGVWGHPSFCLRKADITEHNEIDRIVDERSHDAIVHLAAIVGDPACKRDPALAERTNRDASLHLIEKAMSAGIPRFVFASTCSNYGKMLDPDGYVDETSPLRPVSLYATLKVEVEKLLLEQIERSDRFCPTALRFATVYGTSPRTRFDLTVNEFVRELVLGRDLVVFGEQFWRPYCNVRDFARAVCTVLQADRGTVAYEVFNVGDTEENYTKKMIVDEMLKRIPNGCVKYVHKEEDPRDYRVRFDRIRDVLSFAVSRTLPEGIDDVLDAIRLGAIPDPDAARLTNTPPQ